MMFEAAGSAFDEALAKPFLNEPAKKKWSLILSSAAASTVATIFSEYYYDNDGTDDTVSDSSDCYEAPTLEGCEEVIVFDHNDQELRLCSTLKSIDIEAAILQERHESITEVHQSMSQILDIQNGKSSRHAIELIFVWRRFILMPGFLACLVSDLSALVNAQDDDIEHLLSLSIDAKEHAEAGVKQLQGASQYYSVQQQQRFLVFYMLLMIIGTYWMIGTSNAAEGDIDVSVVGGP
jgi:hypothetical protein